MEADRLLRSAQRRLSAEERILLALDLGERDRLFAALVPRPPPKP